MIIDYTFFQDGLLLVDGAMALATPSPTNEAISNRISSFIERYEPEYLRKLLGEGLYNDFLVYEESEKTDDVWEEFKSRLVIEGFVKSSPIANYVYFHLVRSNQSTATINGVKGEENNVSPKHKMIYAWNDMVYMNRRLYDWMDRNLKGLYTDCELLETINEFNV